MAWIKIDVDAKRLGERREIFRGVLGEPEQSEVTISATLAWEMVYLLEHIIDEAGGEEE